MRACIKSVPLFSLRNTWKKPTGWQQTSVVELKTGQFLLVFEKLTLWKCEVFAISNPKTSQHWRTSCSVFPCMFPDLLGSVCFITLRFLALTPTAYMVFNSYLSKPCSEHGKAAVFSPDTPSFQVTLSVEGTCDLQTLWHHQVSLPWTHLSA